MARRGARLLGRLLTSFVFSTLSFEPASADGRNNFEQPFSVFGQPGPRFDENLESINGNGKRELAFAVPTEERGRRFNSCARQIFLCVQAVVRCGGDQEFSTKTNSQIQMLEEILQLFQATVPQSTRVTHTRRPLAPKFNIGKICF